MKIFEKDYNWEELYDFERDLTEALDPTFNDKAPTEGEFKGIIKVTVEYLEEEDE